MLNQIRETTQYVCDNSEYVFINYKVIDKLIKGFKTSSFWLSSNPFDILSLDYKEIINFLIIYHTIGDYCFWGNPKWTIDTDIGQLDGSFAIIYIILNRLKASKSFDMSFDDFKNMLKGNVEIPLLNERYEELVTMNNILGKNSFYEMIKDYTDDNSLFNYIVDTFPYFHDVRNYKGKKIYFYKRAQLITSDILHVRYMLEKVNVDYSHLVGCADYKIPQVMNSLGIINYSKELNTIIKSNCEIPVNSKYEVEIRANTLRVIDYIYEKLNRKIPRIDINDFIWLLGQDKSIINKSYHRTKTINY